MESRKNKKLLIPPRFIIKNVVVSLSEVIDWGLRLVGIPDIWTVTQGENIKVCVLDTGVDYSHPDLKDAIEDVADFTGSLSGPFDINGHGTHCCGIIAARRNNAGMVGVAPQSRIYSGKVLGDSGIGEVENIIKGIKWGLKKGADVFSLSLGTFEDDPELKAVIQDIFNDGKIIVAAAGNESRSNFINFPARYEECIAVGSINKLRLRSANSNRSSDLDIVAPGEDIYSTYLGKSYAVLSGTSMATPFVAGVCALILSKHRTSGGGTPINNNRDMLAHLAKTAIDLGRAGVDSDFGNGLIHIEKGVRSLAMDVLANVFYTDIFTTYEGMNYSSDKK
ncbi:S8 family peptidase [Larkinella sp.]|uniref:S8 family peptidase n=1 Tax=Larkinella sp. TaxID=2034517 RepID=UPI003BAACB0B